MKSIKLKSYTIIEVIISMIIMSVIVLIAYSVFFSLSKQFDIYRKTQENLFEYSLFKSTLKREFFKSKEVSFDGGILSMHFEKDKIDYKFKNKIVCRQVNNNNVVDTFYVNVKNITPNFIDSSKKGIISKLELELLFFKENTFVFLEKKYGADVLINDFFEYED